MSTFRGYSSYPRERIKFGHILAISGLVVGGVVLTVPMFATAHLSLRGGAVSLSNAKQQALAAILYSDDNGTMLPLGTAWNTGKDQLCYPQPVGCFSTWAWATRAYAKEQDFYRDDSVRARNRGPESLRWDTFYSDFGYNYVHLSPYRLRSDGRVAVSSVSVEHLTAPANTVMIASKWSPALVKSRVNWANAFPGGMVMDAAVEPPVCAPLPQLCLTGWGRNGFFDQSQASKGLYLDEQEGRYTGGVARRHYNQAFVAFADGHGKKLTAAALAAGTNWRASIEAKDVLLTSPRNYLWSATK